MIRSLGVIMESKSKLWPESAVVDRGAYWKGGDDYDVIDYITNVGLLFPNFKFGGWQEDTCLGLFRG